MENISKQYAEVQLLVLNLEKAINEYEQHEQTLAHSQALVHAFSKTFQAFCELLAAYLSKHHAHLASGTSAYAILTHAHEAGFLAEHDLKIMLQAAQEKDLQLGQDDENPLIHNLENYIETMQTILSEIKP